MRRFSRRLGMATVAALATVSLMTLTSVASAAPLTQPADFYTVPNPLPAGNPGDPIRSEPSTVNNAHATRIMYLSKDAKDKPMAVTGTVLVPNTPWNGPGPRPVVAYAPFTAGLGQQCAVSKTLAGQGNNDMVAGVQTNFINALLQKGFAVAQTDYQGLGTQGAGDHTYVMRLPTAHAVLDVIRAAQRLPGTGLPPNGPVGIAGYSQGGGASAAAVELAPQYAPELQLKGAYAGAPPADLAVLAKTLDGSYTAGFLGYAMIGMNAAYPEAHILDLANNQGRQLFDQARTTCTLQAVFSFAFKQSKDLTKDGRPVAAYLNQAPFNRIVAENKVGNLKPTAPVLAEQAPGDDIVNYDQGKQMAKDWCSKSATVQWQDMPSFSPFFSHITEAMMFASNDASNYLADQFTGKPAPGNCGHF